MWYAKLILRRFEREPQCGFEYIAVDMISRPERVKTATEWLVRCREQKTQPTFGEASKIRIRAEFAVPWWKPAQKACAKLRE
ncbi:hypothetical protein GCM10010873_25560 [Cypionkella aquatica]|uniref:Uncharacterized protein n=1 Tax=Cypionkella aquatica TaxID=1756042 RepID=A0AA37U0C1_9RHOB|nr:hypothetical protein GCM10010873_25560 [Cypionkella aquatica]